MATTIRARSPGSFGLSLFLAFLAFSFCLADEPWAKKIAFSGARGRPEIARGSFQGGGNTYKGRVFRTICIEDGKPIRDEDGRVVIFGSLAQEIIHPVNGIRPITVNYPVRTGEIMPVAGYVYRVGEFREILSAPLEWIPDKDLPAGLSAVKPDSFVIP